MGGEAALEFEFGGVPVFIPREIPARLQRLVPAFQIVWATSWGRLARDRLAPALGLPPNLPVIDLDRYPPARAGQSRKLPALRRWFTRGAVALVDDEIDRDLAAWARRRPEPTLLIEADPRVGLQEAQVEELLAWSRRLREEA